jgi:hypothetical protein
VQVRAALRLTGGCGASCSPATCEDGARWAECSIVPFCRLRYMLASRVGRGQWRDLLMGSYLGGGRGAQQLVNGALLRCHSTQQGRRPPPPRPTLPPTSGYCPCSVRLLHSFARPSMWPSLWNQCLWSTVDHPWLIVWLVGWLWRDPYERRVGEKDDMEFAMRALKLCRYVGACRRLLSRRWIVCGRVVV